MDYIVWKITESEEELRAELEHPELYADKVSNLKPGSRRMLEVLAVRRAMKELFYGQEQRVEYDEHGRPSLAGGPYISISHTKGYVAVITDDVPVGIDIERREHRVQRVTSQFLRHEELAMLAMTPDNDLALHLAWSAKEAAFKILGQEYYDLKQRTTISRIDIEKRSLWMEIDDYEKPLKLRYDYTDDYVLVWTECTLTVAR